MVVVASYHEYQVVPRQPVVRLLEDGLEQQRVLGQPLHGPHEDVEEAEAVAVLLRLAPRQVRLEDLVLAVLVAAVLLAVGLLRAVARVGREYLLELQDKDEFQLENGFAPPIDNIIIPDSFEYLQIISNPTLINPLSSMSGSSGLPLSRDALTTALMFSCQKIRLAV